MVQKIITIISVLLFSVTCVADQHGVLINTTNISPYTSADRGGFLDVIAGEAFKRSGLNMILVRQPPERGLLNANTGQIDGDLTRIHGVGSLYPNLVRVEEKLIDWEFAAFSSNPEKLARWREDTIQPIGFIKGWKIYEAKTKWHENITVANDYQQLFRLLEKGRVDVVLFEKWQGLAVIKELGLSGKFYHSLIEKKPMYIFLNKKHEATVSKLAVALKQIKEEGFYDAKYNELLVPYLGINE